MALLCSNYLEKLSIVKSTGRGNSWDHKEERK